MPELVLLTGILITGISLYLIAKPVAMAGILDKVFSSGWLYGAAMFRLVLGAVLIGSAHTVAYAGAVEIFGWLFAIGGLTLVVVPRPVLQRMVDRFSRLSPAGARLWLCASLLFGLFFVWACFA